MGHQCRTSFVVDAPTRQDAFGAHSRLADVVFDLASKTTDHLCIGLEGSWGAGKSSVVAMLSERCQRNDNIALILFDAWSHEGDPLRRAVIEALAEGLHARRWLSKETRARVLERVSHRARSSRTRSFPSFTGFGRAILVALMTTPIGLALFNASLSDVKSFIPTPGAPIVWRCLTGLALGMSPLLIALAALLWRAMRGPKSSSNPTDGLLGLLINHQVTDVISETIEDADPTSNEFTGMLRAMLDEALAKSGRRLFLVPDNLDRVASRDALRLWSTVHSILHLSEHSRPEWGARLTIVVPYAPEGMRRLWDGQHEGVSETAAQLDKLFNLRLEVPTPLLGQWKQYLLAQLARAMPDHDADDFNAVYRLFAEYARGRRDTTPRRLVRLVNAIASAHLRHGHDWPLTDVAYYALLQMDGRDVAFGLQEQSLPQESLLPFLSREVVDNLAAQAFDTSVEDARQLLLAGPLRSALESGDQEQLKRLSKRSSGFNEVIETLDLKSWTEGIDQLAAAAMAVSRSGLVPMSEHAHACGQLIQQLELKARRLVDLRGLTSGNADGVAALCDLVGKQDFRILVIEKLSNTEIDTGQAVQPPAISHLTWVRVARALVEGALDAGDAPDERITIEIPGDGGAVLSVAAELGRGDGWMRVAQSMRARADAEAIVEAIKSELSEGRLDGDLVAALAVLRWFEGNVEWSEVVGVVDSRCTVGGSASVAEVAAAMRLLSVLKDASPEAEQLRQGLLASEALLHWVGTASTDEAEARGELAFEYLKARRAVPRAGVALPGNGAKGAGVLRQLFAKPESYKRLMAKCIAGVVKDGDVEWLLDLSTAEPEATIFVRHIMEGALESAGAALLPWEVVRSRWSELAAVFAPGDAPGLTQLGLVELLGASSWPEPAMAKWDAVGTPAELLNLMLQCGASAKGSIERIVVERTRHRSKGDWSAVLSNDASECRLLLEYAAGGGKAEASQELLDALLENAEAVADGAGGIALTPDAWVGWRRWLEQTGRLGYFARSLYAMASDLAERCDGRFYVAYGWALDHEAVWASDELVVVRLLMRLVAGGPGEGLAWCSAAVTAQPEALARLRREDLEELAEKSRRESARPERSDVDQANLDRLATALESAGFGGRPADPSDS